MRDTGDIKYIWITVGYKQSSASISSTCTSSSIHSNALAFLGNLAPVYLTLTLVILLGNDSAITRQYKLPQHICSCLLGFVTYSKL